MKKYVLAVGGIFIVFVMSFSTEYSRGKAILAGTVAALIAAAIMGFWEFVIIPLWRGIKAAMGID